MILIFDFGLPQTEGQVSPPMGRRTFYVHSSYALRKSIAGPMDAPRWRTLVERRHQEIAVHFLHYRDWHYDSFHLLCKTPHIQRSSIIRHIMSYYTAPLDILYYNYQPVFLI